MKLPHQLLQLGWFFCLFSFLWNPNSYAEGPNISTQERSTVESETSKEGCIIEKFTLHSKSMEREIGVIVVLPPEYKEHPEKKYPILYTLHGGDAPFDTYSQMSPLRSALKKEPMIVTCFNGDKASYFLDSPFRQKPCDYSNEGKKKGASKLPLVKSLFTTFFFNEFVPYLDQHYRVNEKQRMLTGFSMGGFGAFHYMLMNPQMFVSVSSLSGYFAFDDGRSEQEELAPLLGVLAKHRARYDALNFCNQIKKLAEEKVKLPAISLYCGIEDPLMADSIKMHDFLQKQGYPSSLKKSRGIHDWKFWKGVSKEMIHFHWKSLNQ